MECPQNTQMFNAAVSVLHTVAFPDLGEQFVEKCLGIPKEAMNHCYAESPREKLQKNLDQLPADKAEEFRKLMTMVQAEDVKKLSPPPPVEQSVEASLLLLPFLD